MPLTNKHLNMTLEFPLQWADAEVKYLGIWLSSDVQQLWSLNFGRFLNWFEDKVKLWSLLPLSLAGRIAILKMLVLPKLLYLFANIPVPFTRAFFHKIRSTALSLIWAGTIPRIAWSLLVRPMSKGGLGAPDFELYTLCAQAQYLQYWIHPIPFQPHVATEADVAEPIPLNMAVYYPYHRTPHKINTVEMVQWAWDGLRRRAQVPLLYAPSIPISRHPSFPFLHDKEAIDRAQAIGDRGRWGISTQREILYPARRNRMTVGCQYWFDCSIPRLDQFVGQ